MCAIERILDSHWATITALCARHRSLFVQRNDTERENRCYHEFFFIAFGIRTVVVAQDHKFPMRFFVGIQSTVGWKGGGRGWLVLEVCSQTLRIYGVCEVSNILNYQKVSAKSTTSVVMVT